MSLTNEIRTHMPGGSYHWRLRSVVVLVVVRVTSVDRYYGPVTVGVIKFLSVLFFYFSAHKVVLSNETVLCPMINVLFVEQN